MPIRIFSFMLAFMFTLSLSCQRNGSTADKVVNKGLQLRILGVIEGGMGNEVILEEMGAREYIPLDTVICDATGTFELSFASDHIAFYVLRPGGSAYITLLMEPGESLRFESSTKSPGNYTVKGSPGSELLLKLKIEHQKTLEALGEITRKNSQYVHSPDYPELKQTFDRQFDSITTRFRAYSLQYIEENSASLAILVALYNLYGQGLPVFDPAVDLEVYRFADSALMINYSDFEAVQLLHAQVKESEQLLVGEPPFEQLQKGKIAPDFVSSRPDGQKLALSDLRGNYVLLNFWAGWSQLSRNENPALKKAMDTFGKRNLRILQVSLDDNREVWLNAIREDQLKWDHVSDLNRWDSPAVDLFHVDKVPFTVIIDPEGRIVETNLFGEELLKVLERIYKN